MRQDDDTRVSGVDTCGLSFILLPLEFSPVILDGDTLLHSVTTYLVQDTEQMTPRSKAEVTRSRQRSQ